VSSQNSYRLAITIDEETKSLLERFIDLTAHQNPLANKEQAIKMALKVAVKEIEKMKMGKDIQPSDIQNPKTQVPELLPLMTKVATVSVVEAKPIKSPSAPESRYIPLPIRRSVWRRDQGICRYVDPINGRSCRSTHSLQIDHVLEFARGGSHSPQNLRLLCAQHNRFRNRGGNW
jgi:5-methylcytosine-specific restriction endonuclease McrA